MTAFAFDVTVPVPPGSVTSAALGPNSSTKFAQNDVGKLVKLGSAQNYVLCADGDEVEGFVTSVEPFTVNDGFSFGGVQRWGRLEAVVGAEEAGTVAVGEYVVAAAQTALGTAGTPKVKGGTPTKFLWRCIRVKSGTGAAGDTVIIEREM